MESIDYKKKYKEALEKARQLCAYPTTKPFISDLQDLFPELVESEDERIKKEIIEYIKTGTYHKDWIDWIAWLEKQSKKKSIWHKVEPKEYVLEKTLICKENGEIDLVEDTILSVTDAKYALPVSFLGIPKSLEKQDEMKEIISEDATVDSNEDGLIAETIRYKKEKQAEQKPNKEHDICDTCDEQASCVDPCCAKLVEKQKPNSVLDIDIPFGANDSELQEASYHIPEGFHAEIEGNRVVIKQGEQNSAWSEEDEEHLNSIIGDIKTNMGVYPRSQEVIDIYNDDISFLKSLKYRVQPQPRQEWSEEDKKMLGLLFDLVNYASDFYIHEDKSTDLKQWILKTLRPHNTWKPSEEQMDALEDAIADAVSSIHKNMLNSLYNDLKKLKG